ncbi:MAG TPA: cytochrome c [Verrucomicrobiae bacterium]|nr:cytochrome c [Verrucomicrobiae bacterium]
MNGEQSRAPHARAPDGPSKSGLRKLGIIALFSVLGISMLVIVYLARNWSVMAKARKLQNPVPSTAEALAAGKESYRQHCQSCHGERGDGKGDKAPELSVAPGDFTDVRVMHRFADGELYWQITYGRKPMPEFGSKLSEEKRWELVDYIRTFANQPER